MGEIVSWMQVICSFDLKFDEGKKIWCKTGENRPVCQLVFTQGIELCFKLSFFVLKDTQWSPTKDKYYWHFGREVLCCVGAVLCIIQEFSYIQPLPPTLVMTTKTGCRHWQTSPGDKAAPMDWTTGLDQGYPTFKMPDNPRWTWWNDNRKKNAQ